MSVTARIATSNRTFKDHRALEKRSEDRLWPPKLARKHTRAT